MLRTRNWWSKPLPLACLAAVFPARLAWADGNETLGPPDGVTVAAGTQVVMKGVGLRNGQPDSFTIDIPAGVSIEQVFAYWAGFDHNPADTTATDTISVNGGPVIGDLIGGPNFFFSGAYGVTYRAELPVSMLANGPNLIEVDGLSFTEVNDGFGLLVIVDDGVSNTSLSIRDGNDTAFINFPDPRRTTVPQTFTFDPVTFDRTATFSHFFASVEANRPTIITIDIPGFPQQTLNDAIGDSDGDEWDTLTHDVTIPADAEEVTVQVLSADCCASGDLPASLVWTATSFYFPLPCLGTIGDRVWADADGDGCQDLDEDGVAGVTVRLREGCGGDVVAMTTTDAEGYYSFGELCAGDYEICFGPEGIPSGWVETVPNACDNDETDSDCVGGKICMNLPTDVTEDLTNDCGLIPCLGRIGDRVWEDTNGDGCQDGGEPGIAGVTVLLLDACEEGVVIGSTVTGANGYYVFEDLCAGEYQICIGPDGIPDGYVETTPNACGNDETDSDCVDGKICVELPDNLIEDLTNDCGLVPPGPDLSCRMTAGANARNKMTAGNHWSVGGQVGAPTASQPDPCGEWTHRQHRGSEGSFTFHGGTASAIEGTMIVNVVCSDTPPCTPSGNPPSPVKDLDFQGIGSFRNIRDFGEGLFSNFEGQVVPGETLHWFDVHTEDLGEPGNQDRDDCPPQGTPGTPGDCACPDFYWIRIYLKGEPPSATNPLIYEVYDYLEGGNFQTHGPTNGSTCAR